MQRSPIVVILGHVDHGKTTLLDTLRKLYFKEVARITEGEAGGITQSIGAYQVFIGGKPITFIDTPGHAAFATMRARGARVADIAILIVAADDGVQPQTIEAIGHIKAAKIPYVVAINKIDAAGADVMKVKTQLTEHDSAVEKFGGTVPVVEISAKKGTHIPELLDMIFLVADLEELESKPQAPLQAPVIESFRDTRSGPLVSAIVREGTLSIGDVIHAEYIGGKVRALTNDRGERKVAFLPGEPVQILGFKDVVPVGAVIQSGEPKERVSEQKHTTTVSSGESERMDVPSVYILKADSQGTLEALHSSMPQDATIIMTSVGHITESDVILAESTKATIVGFRVKVPTSVTKLAASNGVLIVTNEVIYKLFEELEEIRSGTRKPIETELGHAVIKKVFMINGQQILGCMIESGRVCVGDRVHVVSENGQADGIVKQARQGKVEITTAKSGNECGLFIVSSSSEKLNASEGNAIIAFKTA